MSDFDNAFWNIYIAAITAAAMIGCVLLLRALSVKRAPTKRKADTTGHVWDGDLAEYNNPLPRWWIWLFYVTIVFGVIYLVLYPGLGSFAGIFGWTSRGQYQAETKKADAKYGPIYAKYEKEDLKVVAKDPEARAIGQRLFLNYCSPCHGSDAGGAFGFPNLRDQDWLYGGDPQTIKKSIMEGRHGVMPPLGAALGEDGVKAVANYVLSLSGSPHDAKLAAAGKEKFALCAACHGPEGKGNTTIGAPNLTDNIWLYGGSEKTIIETISKGRSGTMPAWKDFLGEAKVHLLAAYVYGLSTEPPAHE